MVNMKALLAGALVLGGCTPAAELFTKATANPFPPPEREALLAANWAETPGPTPPIVPLRYCYSTLADPVCYDAPVVGAEERLIADPDPNSRP